MASTEKKVAHRYVRGRDISQRYGISGAALRDWANAQRITCIRAGEKGKRFYSLQDVQRELGVERSDDDDEPQSVEKEKICYARVSSTHQTSSLDFQRAELARRYPEHRLIADVGSGLNWHRKGFTAILDSALGGTLAEVVVVHRDRLCRFGFELVERIFTKCNVRLVVLRIGDGDATTSADVEQRGFNELAEDLLAVTTFFSAQYNGRRSAETKRKRRAEQLAASSSSRSSSGNKKPKNSPVSVDAPEASVE